MNYRENRYIPFVICLRSVIRSGRFLKDEPYGVSRSARGRDTDLFIRLVSHIRNSIIICICFMNYRLGGGVCVTNNKISEK